jgi:hypothetical protein
MWRIINKELGSNPKREVGKGIRCVTRKGSNVKDIVEMYNSYFMEIIGKFVQQNNGSQAPQEINSCNETMFHEEYRIARSYREENIQYLNYLLAKENWELLLKQNSVNEAYNAFSDTFKYYYDIAMPKKRVQTERQRNKWVTAGIRVSGNRLRFLNILMKQGNMPEEE